MKNWHAFEPRWLQLDWKSIRRLVGGAAKLLLIVAGIGLVGLITGIMVVILPPLASIGVVGLALAVLLWVMPDLPHVPERHLATAFVLAILVQFTIPVYYALPIPGLPWISVRRLTWFSMVLLTAICYAGSADVRRRAAAALGASPLLSFCVIGYLCSIFLSITTSAERSSSLKDATDSLIYWYSGFAAAIIVLTTVDRIRVVFRIIVAATIFAALVSAIEWKLQYNFLYAILPGPMKTALFVNNPAIAEALAVPAFRNGLYRSSFVYMVSLSFGEFMAVCAPLTLFFVMHGRNFVDKVFGAFGFLCCLMGVLASGSRGALGGVLIALPVIIFCWLIRLRREQPMSLIPAFAAVSATATVIGFTVLSFTWLRLQVMLTGGGHGALSTDARYIQWELAKPWIAKNPITGHGVGVGGYLIGYYNPGSTIPSVDSTVITLLVDTGVPGLLLFFGMIGIAILLMLYHYLHSTDLASEFAGPVAAALIAFGFYRLALTQRENHPLFYLLLAIALMIVAIIKGRVQVPAAQPRYGPAVGAAART